MVMCAQLGDWLGKAMCLGVCVPKVGLLGVHNMVHSRGGGGGAGRGGGVKIRGIRLGTGP